MAPQRRKRRRETSPLAPSARPLPTPNRHCPPRRASHPAKLSPRHLAPVKAKGGTDAPPPPRPLLLLLLLVVEDPRRAAETDDERGEESEAVRTRALASRPQVPLGCDVTIPSIDRDEEHDDDDDDDDDDDRRRVRVPRHNHNHNMDS